MVSLVDIAKRGSSQATVSIRGVDMRVNGITAEQVVDIFMEFPEIRRILTSSVPDSSVVQSLLARFPEAAGLILAAGTGTDLGNKEERDANVAAARSLSIGEQYDLFEKILECTFPRGATNFLAGVQRLVEQNGGGRGWAPATISPAPSSVASSSDGEKTTAGDQPQSS